MSSYEVWNNSGAEINLSLSDNCKTQKVKSLMEQFILSDKDVETLNLLFEKEIDEGLKMDETKRPQHIGNMSMNVTYFTELFDGSEEGNFVVIILTSKHLILSIAEIKPGFPVKLSRKYFIVEEKIRKSPYIAIFEYLCDCLLNFFTENHLLNEPQIIGFCTDLPMVRFSIDKAIISYFTPEASCFPLNCYDIQKCFKTVLLKDCYKEIKFSLVSVMNINTSLLIYSAYIFGPIDIFVNLENDCDIIYKEEIERVQKCNLKDLEAEYIFIDTELRNFGRNGSLDFMSTAIDWSVITQPMSLTAPDRDCRLGKFLTDYYILELIRHILVALHRDLIYCRERSVGTLYEINGISLPDIATFANVEDVDQATQLLPALILGSHDETRMTKYVFEIVVVRAALLISISLSQLMMRFQKDDLIIAIKCPMLEHYLKFETYIRNFIAILAPMKKFQLLAVSDNTYMEGAALATAIAHRMKTCKENKKEKIN